MVGRDSDCGTVQFFLGRDDIDKVVAVDEVVILLSRQVRNKNAGVYQVTSNKYIVHLSIR